MRCKWLEGIDVACHTCQIALDTHKIKVPMLTKELEPLERVQRVTRIMREKVGAKNKIFYIVEGSTPTIA